MDLATQVARLIQHRLGVSEAEAEALTDEIFSIPEIIEGQTAIEILSMADELPAQRDKLIQGFLETRQRKHAV